MRAAALYEFGGPDKFQIIDMPVPEPTPGKILIRNHFVGIHYADIRQREGIFPFNLVPMPAVIGFEVAGTIEAVGEGVEGWRPGTRVMAALLPKPDEFGKRSMGGYAEYSIADREAVSEIPEHVSFEQALVYLGNLPAAYTLYSEFQTIAPDSTIMIHTGAGGLGTSLTQVAKAAGNTVIALVRKEEKADVCREFGADHVVISSRDGWVDEVRNLTGGRGVDVSFNTTGGSTIKQDINALAYRGRIVHTALAQGLPQDLDTDDVNKAVFGNFSFQFTRTAEMLRAGPIADKARAYRDAFLRTGKLHSPMAIYDLEDVVRAHADFESGKTAGKVVLKVV